MTASTSSVIVYSSTHCTYCRQLKQYLQGLGVSYEERNIDTNDQFAEELQAMGMSSVPVSVIGDAKILGMNTTRIKKALAELEGAQE